MQARLLETPDLLRNVSDVINRFGNATSSSLSSLSRAESGILVSSAFRHTLKPRRCSCRPSTYCLKSPFWGASLSSSALVHRESCDFFEYPERENLWNLRFIYCGRLIARAITASIHLRRGAGGFSISPKLNCSRAVPYEGSIFSLVDSFVLPQLQPVIKGLNIDSFIKRLDQEFRVGNASPHDVDERGNTLLHVSQCLN